jgi:hypothetical protein
MNWFNALRLPDFLCLFVYILPWGQPFRPKLPTPYRAIIFFLLKDETCHMQSDSVVENMVMYGPVDNLRTRGANARTNELWPSLIRLKETCLHFLINSAHFLLKSVAHRVKLCIWKNEWEYIFGKNSFIPLIHKELPTDNRLVTPVHINVSLAHFPESSLLVNVIPLSVVGGC